MNNKDHLVILLSSCEKQLKDINRKISEVKEKVNVLWEEKCPANQKEKSE